MIICIWHVNGSFVAYKHSFSMNDQFHTWVSNEVVEEINIRIFIIWTWVKTTLHYTYFVTISWWPSSTKHEDSKRHVSLRNLCSSPNPIWFMDVFAMIALRNEFVFIFFIQVCPIDSRQLLLLSLRFTTLYWKLMFKV